MSDFAQHSDEWVEHGFISSEQAVRIRRYEGERRPDRGGVVEILGYIGALLVLSAGLVIVGEMWDSLKRGGRIAVTGLAAAALIGAGVNLATSSSRATRRMGEAALMLGAVPLGLAIGLTLGDQADEEPAVTMAFVGALVYSVIVYRWRPTWLQHIALFGSAAGTAISLGILITDENMFVAGALLAILGIGWLAASWNDLLPPQVLAEVGAVLALGLASIFFVADLGPDTAGGLVAMSVCVAVSAGMITIGVLRDRIVLITGGALGLLGYLPWLLDELIPGAVGGPIALLAAGCVLIGAAVLLTKRAARR
jgi:hypothetical protein